MKKSLVSLWRGIAIASLLVVLNVHAADQAASLDELLQLIEQSALTESRENRAREEDFRRSNADHAQLLAQAKKRRAAEERRSEELEKRFADNDLQLVALQKQLQQRLGSLEELFGHLTSTANDVRTSLSQSIVSAQLPGRTVFADQIIKKMNGNTRLPTIEEIERLWYEMNREMVEGGKVVKFPASVVNIDGEKEQQEVVRVGLYNLLSEGNYLTYNPKTELISVLARQPASSYRRAAGDLQVANSGMTRTGIDPTGPTGGFLLSAMVSTPDTLERIKQGGLVGGFIIAMGIVAMLLAIYRFVVLYGVSGKVSAQLKSDAASDDNPLGRVLKVGEENPGMDAESLELKLHEAVLRERPEIEFGINVLKITSMLAPLMGLLGTVIGMINTFQAITLFGAGDPTTMAAGISGALVTTVLGLCVAIPMVLAHTVVNGRAQRVLHILEEQSAGIIAEKAEG